mmetsp:Transcript_22693/g.56361  ORF Transcript_22693/g.56361 Transcript_22693/m.56361 type:complete len:1538 (-) Transcript_22693:532-5145(-)
MEPVSVAMNGSVDLTVDGSGSSVETVTHELSPGKNNDSDHVSSSAAEPADLDKHPILQQWRFNPDGSLVGRVFGKRGFKEGENMNTSVVPPDQRFSRYVVTESGSIYRLGEPLTATDVKKPVRTFRPRVASDENFKEGKKDALDEDESEKLLKRPKLDGEASSPHGSVQSSSTDTARRTDEPLRPKIKPPTLPGWIQGLTSSGGNAAVKTAPSPTTASPPRPKHPNQYTVRATQMAGVTLPRPKQPNQYTKNRDKLKIKPLSKPSGGAAALQRRVPASPAKSTCSSQSASLDNGKPRDPKGAIRTATASRAAGGLPAIYLQGSSWVAALKTSAADHNIGAYSSAKLAAEAMFAYLAAAYVDGLTELDEMNGGDTQLSAILSSKNQSGFQGVNKSSRAGHWEAAIQEGGKRRFLGCFPSAQAAAIAYAREFTRMGGGNGGDTPTQDKAGGLASNTAATDLSPVATSPGPTSRSKERVQREIERSVWIQCEACSKWRRLNGIQALGSASGAWVCLMNTDKTARSCEEPEDEEASVLLSLKSQADSPDKEDEIRQKGGRGLRPLKPVKAAEEVPRDMLRARLPAPAGRKRDRETDQAAHSKGSRSPRAPSGANGKQYMGVLMGRASTRIAVHEDGVWRFQPAVGEEYQVEVEPVPSTPTVESCRSRLDTCLWCPDKATAEGIDVEAFLEGAERLNSAALEPLVFTPEGALRALSSHDYDVLAAAASMATALGADKVICPVHPVSASVSIVRGRNGARASLQLTPSHLAASICRGQPQGANMRATRSRAVALDPPTAKLVWTQEEERAFTLAMRKFGSDLWTIQRRALPERSLPQVVELYYSEKGQKIEAEIEAERAAAEKVRAATQAATADAAEKEKPQSKMPKNQGEQNAPGKGKKAVKAECEKAVVKRARSSESEAQAKVAKRANGVRPAHRLGPRVVAHLSVRNGVGVRVRLRVKNTERRTSAAGAGAKSSTTAAGQGNKALEARLQVANGGHVKVLLDVSCEEAALARRPARVRKPKLEVKDEVKDDDGNEMICTWLQCDRCSKWRIVPEGFGTDDDRMWYCEDNVDKSHNRCSVPQQPDDAVGDFAGLLEGASQRAAATASSRSGGHGAPSGSPPVLSGASDASDACASGVTPAGANSSSHGKAAPAKRDRSAAGTKRQRADKEAGSGPRQRAPSASSRGSAPKTLSDAAAAAAAATVAAAAAAAAMGNSPQSIPSPPYDRSPAVAAPPLGYTSAASVAPAAVAGCSAPDPHAPVALAPATSHQTHYQPHLASSQHQPLLACVMLPAGHPSLSNANGGMSVAASAAYRGERGELFHHQWPSMEMYEGHEDDESMMAGTRAAVPSMDPSVHSAYVSAHNHSDEMHQMAHQILHMPSLASLPSSGYVLVPQNFGQRGQPHALWASTANALQAGLHAPSTSMSMQPQMAHMAHMAHGMTQMATAMPHQGHSQMAHHMANSMPANALQWSLQVTVPPAQQVQLTAISTGAPQPQSAHPGSNVRQFSMPASHHIGASLMSGAPLPEGLSLVSVEAPAPEI